MSKPTVLVLGASGKTGRRVLPRLRLRNVTVRPASRSAGIAFDWSAPSTWDAAVDEVDAIYMVAPTWPGPAEEFLDRARIAGAQRVTLLSGRVADGWSESIFGADMRAAEDAVQESQLDWTILRCNNFAQNFSEDVYHGPLVRGELALPAGEVPEPFVDIEDVSEVAARVLTEPGHGGKTYELSGPCAITFGEATKIIAQATGLGIRYRQVGAPEYIETLQQADVPRAAAEYVAAMFDLMADGGISNVTEGVATVLGREPYSFRDYAVRAAAVGAWTR